MASAIDQICDFLQLSVVYIHFLQKTINHFIMSQMPNNEIQRHVKLFTLSRKWQLVLSQTWLKLKPHYFDLSLICCN